MSIEKLVAGTSVNDPAASTGAEVATSVNALIDLVDGADNPKQLMPSDWVGIRLTSSLNGKLYGVAGVGSNNIFVYDVAAKTTQTITTFADASAPQKVIAITDSIWLVESELSNVRKLFRTADGGATFAFIQNFNTGIAASGLLSARSVCQTPNGDLYYVDYNVNSSRTPGGTNDRVSVNKSTDLGLNWSAVAVFNTDGVKSDLRHFHSIRYNSHNGFLYLQCGDGDLDSGIIMWNPATTLPSNTPISQMTQSADLKTYQYGQTGRGVDMLFEGDNIYWLVDLDTNGNGAITGFYTAKADLTGVKRISSALTKCPNLAGWYGAKMPSGHQVWVSGTDVAGSNEKYSGIFCTNKEKTKMDLVGKFCCLTGASTIVPYGLEVVGSVAYYSASNPAGKTAEATAGFYLMDEDYRSTEAYSSPDTIHPVYWVNKATGSNSNNGHTPALAFQTISYAVTGNRIPISSTVIIQDTFYDYNDASAIDPVINSSLRQGDVRIPLCIRGYGATKTKITGNSANSYVALALLPTSYNLNIEFKDLTINNAKTNAYTGRITTVTGASELIYTRCIVGDYYLTTNNVGTIRAQAGTVKLNSSYLTTPAAGTGIDTVGASLQLINSAVDSGGNNLNFQGTGVSLYSYKSILSGSSAASIRFAAGTTLGSNGINFVFGGMHADANGSQVAINDLASLSLSGVVKGAILGIPRGSSTAAFDGYCVNAPRGAAEVNKLDYVY